MFALGKFVSNNNIEIQDDPYRITGTLEPALKCKTFFV